MRPGPEVLALAGSAAAARVQTADKKMAPTGRVKGRLMALIVAAARARRASARSGVLLRSVLWCTLGLWLCLSLGGCAWLSAKQSQFALRPTPGRPASLADDSVLFRPGDVRWRVSVAPEASAGTVSAQTQFATEATA